MLNLVYRENAINAYFRNSDQLEPPPYEPWWCYRKTSGNNDVILHLSSAKDRRHLCIVWMIVFSFSSQFQR